MAFNICTGMIDGTTGLDREQYITPMQWSNDPNAGFSSADPWIAVNPDYNSGVNVAELDSNENSHIHVYREVASLREDKAILYGSTNITVKGNSKYLRMYSKVPNKRACSFINFRKFCPCLAY